MIDKGNKILYSPEFACEHHYTESGNTLERHWLMKIKEIFVTKFSSNYGESNSSFGQHWELNQL